MNKTIKSCLVILILLFLLVIATVGAMFFLDICPPRGPWPMPPWCSNLDGPTLLEISLPVLEEIVPVEPAPTQAVEPTPIEPVGPYQLPEEFQLPLAGPEWRSEPGLGEDFMFGHTFMDVYTNTLFRESLDSTLQTMAVNGANWVVYDNYWSYASFDPPLISAFPPNEGFRNATREELCQMIDRAHGLELKFALMLELNFDLAKGEFTTWEENLDFWQASQRLLDEKGQNVSANLEFWEDWFETYGKFVLNQAAIAQDCGADLFVIGKQIDGAIKPALAERWRELIGQVRDVYSGPVSYAAFTNEHFSQAQDFPLDALDYLIIYLYNRISDLESPAIPELVAAFERFHDRQFEPLSRGSGVPVIFLTPFQSRDFGARQEWFEPAAPAPEVGEDLMVQAMLYEAFFQSLEDEDWAVGVFSWGYWWREDFTRLWAEGDASFNKSSSVRNKPAEWIFRKWSVGVE